MKCQSFIFWGKNDRNIAICRVLKNLPRVLRVHVLDCSKPNSIHVQEKSIDSFLCIQNGIILHKANLLFKRKMGTHSRETTLVKIVLPPVRKGFYSKRKDLLLRGATFLLE